MTVRNQTPEPVRLFGNAALRVEPAVGHLDELRFQDTLVRDVDPQTKRRIPAGCSAYLRGWVFTPAPPQAASEVFVTLGGDVAFPAIYGDVRWDIAPHYEHSGLERVGFRGILPLGGMPLGHYDIRIAAFVADSDDYHLLDAQERFEIVESRYLFPGKQRASKEALETKIDGIETARGDRPNRGVLRVGRGETVIVRGWAFDRARSSTSGGMFGLIDGEQYVLGVHGLPRHDVALAIDIFEARRCGFTIRVPIRGLGRGRHRLDIVTLASDGVTYAITGGTKLLVTA